jgi:hypothetical protein
MSARRRRLATALLVLCASAPLAAPAWAQCSYPFLSSGSPVYWSAGTVLYPTIVQSTNYWSAVAVRPDPGTDWDLSIHQTATTYPACVTNQLASSTRGGSAVDVVIGDFNHNAFGSYYVRPYVYSGTGNARIEWDDGSDIFTVNAPRTQRTTGPNYVIECWDIYLEAGRNYSFSTNILGPANMKLLLYQNPSAAPYWANRNNAYYDIDLPPHSSTIGGIVVDTNDWYALVMVNENGEACDYQLQIESCHSAPAPLASTVTQTAFEPARRYSFVQQEHAFAAVGVRPNETSQYWAIWVGEQAADVSPQCYQTHRASSFGADAVAYVVGDFNVGSNAIGTTYYARTYAPWGTGVSSGTVEWDDGPERIVVDDPPISDVTGPSDVLRCWDVALQAGYRYRFHFTHGGAANLKLALFDNPGGVFWAPRSGARIESGTTFFADITRDDWYALVLANDNGAAGDWEIAVERCASPIPIPDGGAHLSIANPANPPFAIDVANPNWAAMGVRSDAPSQDWNLWLHADRSGNAPGCLSGEQASSQLPAGLVDVIAGRPNLALGGPSFFPHTLPGLVSSNGIFGWEQGSESIPIGGPPLDHAVVYDEVVRAWDLSLAAGTTYSIVFEQAENLGANLLLFQPGALLAEGDWQTRSQAVLATGGIASYTAAVSGPHGLVVVNDQGAVGNVRIGVYEAGGVAVDAVPTTTRLEGIHPNPVLAGSRIRFALARRADVAFDVVNAAGRRVARLDAGTREPGHASVDWAGTADDGGRLAAGVYFVRMRVDGAAVEDARLVLLP